MTARAAPRGGNGIMRGAREISTHAPRLGAPQPRTTTARRRSRHHTSTPHHCAHAPYSSSHHILPDARNESRTSPRHASSGEKAGCASKQRVRQCSGPRDGGASAGGGASARAGPVKTPSNPPAAAGAAVAQLGRPKGAEKFHMFRNGRKILGVALRAYSAADVEHPAVIARPLLRTRRLQLVER